jgi:hypothetical protein
MCERKFHGSMKILSYAMIICWLINGFDIYFRHGLACKKEAPTLCFTMLVTLIIGSIQLILFTGFFIALFVWGLSKIFGF